MADHDALIQQFSAVSGTDPERAKFFLEAAAWDLSTALSSFFEEGDGDSAAPASNTGAPAAAAVAAGVSDGSSAHAAAEGGEMSSNDSDSDEETQQAFYAGGSTHSGQQVLGPPRKKKDVVANLFKAVKQQGAEEVTKEAGGKKTIRKTFKGTSYRLGETSDDTQVIPDAAASSSRGRDSRDVNLTMWSNGFTVDDGPLRDYMEEVNMHFLSDIKGGKIPQELLKNSGAREVAISMSDRHHEDYVPQKALIKAFTGSGQTLGSPAPAVVGQVSHVPGPGGSVNKLPSPATDPKAQEDQAKKQLNVDTTKPTTNVQIRLMDGTRLVVRANHSHSVGDLRTYVTTARPEFAAQIFALMTTFPHAELSQHEQSLADANLLNAAIVVKTR